MIPDPQKCGQMDTIKDNMSRLKKKELTDFYYKYKEASQNWDYLRIDQLHSCCGFNVINKFKHRQLHTKWYLAEYALGKRDYQERTMPFISTLLEKEQAQEIKAFRTMIKKYNLPIKETLFYSGSTRNPMVMFIYIHKKYERNTI